MNYGSGPYTVAFPAGTTRVPFDIPINNDDIYEVNETFTLDIDPSSLPTDGTFDNPGQATMTIVDDDSKICITFYVGFIMHVIIY